MDTLKACVGVKRALLVAEAHKAELHDRWAAKAAMHDVKKKQQAGAWPARQHEKDEAAFKRHSGTKQLLLVLSPDIHPTIWYGIASYAAFTLTTFVLRAFGLAYALISSSALLMGSGCLNALQGQYV